MPELPDVEAYRRFFLGRAMGQVVRDVVADPSMLRNVSESGIRDALRGRRFTDPARHGKWLVAWTDGPALLLHFGMTGTLVWSGDEPGRHRWDRLILAFEGGAELRYRNMRKLGGVWLAHGPGEVATILGGLGPDALGLPVARIARVLGERRGQAKAALMDQSFIAGIGNLLADEILWRARVHPKRRLDSLDAAERTRLARSVRDVVGRLAEGGDSAMASGRWLIPARRDGGRCPRCGTTLARTVAAGRTTYFCPVCQPEEAHADGEERRGSQR